MIVHAGTMVDLKNFQEIFGLERIASRIIGDDKSCGKGCCPSTFYLQVRREDAQEASEILALEHQRLTGLHEHDLSTADAIFNPEAEEVVCPACGHTFTPSEATCPDCGLCFG